MDEFDYVIVGAGAAGCVLANRLSEDPKVRVALVEAGPDRNARKMLVKVPLAMVTFMAPALARSQANGAGALPAAEAETMAG